MDVVADKSLRRGASGSLGRFGLPLCPQELDRLVDLTLGLCQSGLAIHEAGSGHLTEFFDLCCADCHLSTFL
jgi:hypothetical protein